MDTWRLGWQPKSSRVLTTCKWPLLTAICNGVCRLLFLAFKSAPPLCSTSMTEPSSPKAAWCTALSPSLSWAQWQTRIMTQVISQMTYSHTRKMHKDETGKVQGGSSYLGFQVHVVLEQQLQDVHVPVLTGCLHGGMSSTLAIHLRGKRIQVRTQQLATVFSFHLWTGNY